MMNFIFELLQNILFFCLHFDNQSSFPAKLSKKEEQEYIRRAANGDMSARDTLIKHNLRLVAFIVRKHYPECKDKDDLISIGIIGLIRAAQTFDYSRSISFSTYAGKCINNQIRMHFRKNKHSRNDVYLSEPMECDKDGNPITLADIFSDSVNIEDVAELNLNMKRLYRYINEELDEREKEILTKRYGLCGTGYHTDRVMTQREVAADLDISRSYVSRIEKRALEKLKARFDKGGEI